MNINNLKAERTNRMTGAISELLRVTARPKIISLAGGLPAPESFPLSIINILHKKTVKKYKANAFQYGPTNGAKQLRDAIVRWIKERHIKVLPENVGITSGSQGALDCLGKIFINKNDIIAVESPTYIGALDAFNPYQPEYAEIETDDNGVVPSSLEKILKTRKIKLVYLIPTFQNPTGRTVSRERRIQIAGIIKKNNALLIEDDPYNSIRFRGIPVDPIYTLIPENTVYLSTFSKVLAPGLRIGYYVAPVEVGNLLVSAKQSIDLHTNSYGQYLAAEYLSTGHLKKHLPKILKIYKSRQETMLNALAKYFPPSFQWTHPEGGMFIWIEGPKGLDTEKLYWKAIKKNVAFVPGAYFFARPGEGKNTMRLNYTNVNEKSIEKAINILAEVIKNNL